MLQFRTTRSQTYSPKPLTKSLLFS